MTDDWCKRHKQLLWTYFQVLRKLGPLSPHTTMAYKYEQAAFQMGYEDASSAARVIRQMMADKHLVRYIDSVGSKEEIE